MSRPSGRNLRQRAITRAEFEAKLKVSILSGIEKMGYFDNFALQNIAWLGVGTVIERSCFFFDVV